MSNSWVCPICQDGGDGEKEYHPCGQHEYHSVCILEAMMHHDIEKIKYRTGGGPYSGLLILERLGHLELPLALLSAIISPAPLSQPTVGWRCAVCRYDPGPMVPSRICITPTPCRHCNVDLKIDEKCKLFEPCGHYYHLGCVVNLFKCHYCK